MLAGAHKANLPPARGCQAGTYVTQISVSQKYPTASCGETPNSPLLNAGGGRRNLYNGGWVPALR